MNGKLRPEIAAEYIRRLRGVGRARRRRAHRAAGRARPRRTAARHARAGRHAATRPPAPAHYRHHPRRPDRDHPHLRDDRGAQGGAALARQPLRRHPAPAHHAAGAGHQPDPQRAARPAHRHRADGQPGAGQPRARCSCSPSRAASGCSTRSSAGGPDGVFGFSVTWAELARFDLSGYDLDSVRLWFNTGDCSHEPHIRRLVAVGSRDTVTRDGVVRVPGSVFIDGLGSSEMGHSMFHITHRADTDRYGRCIGRPYEFARVAVLDADGEPVPAGEVGLPRHRLAVAVPGLLERLGHHLPVPASAAGTSPATWSAPTPTAATTTWTGRSTRSTPATGGGSSPRCPRRRILAACPDVTDCTVVIVAEGGVVVTDVLLELAAGADAGEDRTDAGPRRARPGRRRHAAPGGAGPLRRHPGHRDRQGPQGRPARALPDRSAVMTAADHRDGPVHPGRAGCRGDLRRAVHGRSGLVRPPDGHPARESLDVAGLLPDDRPAQRRCPARRPGCWTGSWCSPCSPPPTRSPTPASRWAATSTRTGSA